MFFAIGGAVGAFGWRTPFWLYVASLIVAAVMIAVIWPTQQSDDGAEKRIEKLPPIPWKKLMLPVVVSFVGGITFYTLIVELPYVLATMGVTSTATIGACAAIASLATAIGAFLFRFIAGRGVAWLLPFSFGLAGIGMVVVWFAPNVPLAVIGAVIAGFGNGVLLPTLVTWAIARLDYAQRGRGAGLFTGALFLGEFVTPLVILALTAAAGTLAIAIGVIGIASLVICVVLALVTRRYPQPALAV